MQPFVKHTSIVRKIWGNADTILFIFAGAAAEFALNKAVDWLFFTGRLPADPLGRLFSTVSYARKIVFSEAGRANKAIDAMAAIHHAVEEERGSKIPQWAYRDVLYMLIDYSIRSFELLDRKMLDDEKREVFHVFRRVGERMKIQDLPTTYEHWCIDREEHLQNNVQASEFTTKLFNQYKKHLGRIRYFILISSQSLIVPQKIKNELRLSSPLLMMLLLPLYKVSTKLKLDWYLKLLILPKKYIAQIRELDIA